jgi:hypothetical protein
MQESFSGARVSLIGTSKVTFPLPRGYFPDVQVSEAQTQEYRDLVRRRLDAALADETCCNERLANGLSSLHPRDWKSVRSLDGLQLFRRRHRGRARAELAAQEDFPQAMAAVTNGQPSVVAIGNFPGTIEDVLYGFAGTTVEETRTTMSFLVPRSDAAVLHNFELGTEADPLHFLGLKWLYAARAIGSARDVCCLQAAGVEVDGGGDCYGYLMLHSVDAPEYPPFDPKRTNVVRGKVFFTCIFREKTPGVVDVLARGVFDMSGGRRRFSSLLSPHTTATFIGGLRKLVACADAKKLTVLARRTASRCDPCTQPPPPPRQAVCVVCIKRDGSGLFSATRLRSCRVCGMPICSKCQAKNKRVFLGRHRPWSAVPCCPTCALEAQRMITVQPSETEFAMVADYFIEKRPRSPPAATAMTSFGLPLDAQAARCIETSSKKQLQAGVVSCPNATKPKDGDAASGSLSDSSDLDASQICPSSSSNELQNDESGREDSHAKDEEGKEEAEQLPAVVEELLGRHDKVDCHREQVEFTKRYLLSPARPSAVGSRTTIADFRGQVAVLGSEPEAQSPRSQRDRNYSDGLGALSSKELEATLQALQSTADQIYGDVVAFNAET